MKVMKPGSQIQRSNYLRNRVSRAKHVAGASLALVSLIGVLALPAFCWNQNVSSKYVIAQATNPVRNDAGGLNEWTTNGPKEEIRSLAIDRSNPNIIYAASRNGVFKSTDGGATWSNVGLSNTHALAIDFVNPKILYAGTSSSDIVIAPGRSFLFKSTDGGATWSSSSSPIDFDISLLVMDHTTSQTLYAGSDVEYVFTGGIIVWKSTDGGATWNGWRTGNIGLASYGWAINPANPEILYAPGDLYDGFLPDVIDRGLFKSSDGGANWSATGLTNTSVSTVAIDPLNPDTLYAGTKDNGVVDTPFRGMFKSTDGGDSWVAINTGLSDRVGKLPGIRAFAIDSDDSKILYAGTSARGVFRSADGGASWSKINLGLTNLSINALAIEPLQKHLYAATGAGVFSYQFVAPCTDKLSPANQSLDSNGGTGLVTFTAASQCSWTAASFANWITVTSDSSGSGSGTVSYSVAPNESTAPRIGIIGIAARFLTVTQAGAAVRIYNATVSGKKLLVTGENFDLGSVILLNGEEQKTGNDEQNPTTTVIGKKAGKKIKPGDKLQVRNPNGSLSEEFTFTGL